MKLKTLAIMLFSITLVCVLGSVSNAQTNSDQNNKITKQQKDDDGDEREEKVSSKERKQVKISIEQARKTALERVGGTIIEEELEKEDGRIVYSIEIRDTNQKVFDVEVDAKTGEIVKVEEENDDDEDGDGDGKQR
jgi:uncharacterized membrane protein YkoI